jgi:AcrR family transcriptional regulator
VPVVAARLAKKTLADREAAYTDEVRRLLDAALVVMRRNGTDAPPRVADIVREAGLSNDAFYRHFPSKDALVAAVLEDGTERLRSYVAHQLEKEPTPEAKVRRWVKCILDQAKADVGETTRAALFNAGGTTPGRHPASALLAELLHEPLRELGSERPEFDSALAAHATVGLLSEHLWAGTQPSPADVHRVTAWIL